MSKNLLAPVMEERNRVLHQARQDSHMPIEIKKKICREAKKAVNDAVELAKSVWVSHLAQKIHDLSNNPKSAWEGVKEL